MYVMIKDENMELAIKEAKKAAQRDEIPVGAIIKETSAISIKTVIAIAK